MATYTTNLNLKKPAGTDTADIGDINDNMDILDAAVNNCVKYSASQSLTSSQKTQARTNIGATSAADVNSSMTVVEQTISSISWDKTSYDIPVAEGNYSVSLTGHTPIAIVGWKCEFTPIPNFKDIHHFMCLNRLYLSSNKIHYEIALTEDRGSFSGVTTLKVFVLYKKNA